ncbi:MAG TPA: hypothetical protein VF376_01300, partial [Thermoanaerobaculia bacterium]
MSFREARRNRWKSARVFHLGEHVKGATARAFLTLGALLLCAEILPAQVPSPTPAPAAPQPTPSTPQSPPGAPPPAPAAAPKPTEKIVGIRVIGYQTVSPDTI